MLDYGRACLLGLFFRRSLGLGFRPRRRDLTGINRACAGVHSVVHVDGTEIWLETLADSPDVRVNGRLTRSAALEPGDDLEIGAFSLTLHRTDSSESVQAPRIYGAPVREELTEEEIDNPIEDLEELTARELVELIDQEEAIIEEFEARRRLGAQALMDVVKQRFLEPDVDDGRGKNHAARDRRGPGRPVRDRLLRHADRGDAPVYFQRLQLAADGVGQGRVHPVRAGGCQLRAVQRGGDSRSEHAPVLGDAGQGAVAVDVGSRRFLQQLRYVRGNTQFVGNGDDAGIVAGGNHQFLDGFGAGCRGSEQGGEAQ